jgi:hypothetical protein
MAPRPAATPTVEQRTEPASEHEEEVTPLVRRQLELLLKN